MAGALAILVPVTFAYAGQRWQAPIDDLTFTAGAALPGLNNPEIGDTLSGDAFWERTSAPELDGVRYTSLSGICTVDLVSGDLPSGIRTMADDQLSTVAFLEHIFPDSSIPLDDLPVSTMIGLNSPEDSKTTETLLLTTDLTTMAVRAFAQTDSYIYAASHCVDSSPEAKALAADAFQHIDVLTAIR